MGKNIPKHRRGRNEPLKSARKKKSRGGAAIILLLFFLLYLAAIAVIAWMAYNAFQRIFSAYPG